MHSHLRPEPNTRTGQPFTEVLVRTNCWGYDNVCVPFITCPWFCFHERIWRGFASDYPHIIPAKFTHVQNYNGCCSEATVVILTILA